MGDIFHVGIRVGRASLVVAWRAPLVNAGSMPFGLCRFGEIERKGPRRSRSAGVGPRGNQALPLTKGIEPRGGGEQRAKVLEVRVCVVCSLEGPSDEERRRDPGGTWVWFLSKATALQEEVRLALLPETNF